MAKVQIKEHSKYLQKIKNYQVVADSLLKQEEEMLSSMEEVTTGASLKLLDLVEDMTVLTSYYVVMSGVSEAMLNARNAAALNEGRKSIYKAVTYLEKVVSPFVDAPFSDYEDRLAEITSVNARRRYNIIKKMGLVIQLMQNSFDTNSKWRWAFVELEGRYAVVAKNIIDLKSAVLNSDPRSKDYEPTMHHLKLMKQLLTKAASRYRDRYELTGQNHEDFEKSIEFLEALKRIHTLLGEQREAEVIKKKVDIWKIKLEKDKEKLGENTSDEIHRDTE